jgi:hypothetical protein
MEVSVHLGRAMAQAVSRRPLTAEARFRKIKEKEIPGQSMWDFWWTKWHWDRFFPSTSVFPCQFHSTGALLHGKTEKIVVIFITGLNNKT